MRLPLAVSDKGVAARRVEDEVAEGSDTPVDGHGRRAAGGEVGWTGGDGQRYLERAVVGRQVAVVVEGLDLHRRGDGVARDGVARLYAECQLMQRNTGLTVKLLELGPVSPPVVFSASV